MKKYNKAIFSILFLLFVIFIAAKLIFNHYYRDSMFNNDIFEIRYKTYNKKDKWIHETGNGVTNGNKNNAISNLSINIKGKSHLSYSLYSKENKWTNDITVNKNDYKKNNIRGIKIFVYDELNDRYDICYRTYNKKDGWLGWSCNGSINGNAKEDIYMLQIKMIPKGAVMEEYLENYNISDINNKFF